MSIHQRPYQTPHKEGNRESQVVFSFIERGDKADADAITARDIPAAGLAASGRRGAPTGERQSDPMKRQTREGAAS